ncbi:DUF4124 domain-containing protein [Aliikangiella maris]|uniref:DUF4124 domain-containing protein n=2 Tax=Aliikangiella maris TaxID=3162458 RepID=A0ABV3MJY9_9GAMM
MRIVFILFLIIAAAVLFAREPLMALYQNIMTEPVQQPPTIQPVTTSQPAGPTIEPQPQFMYRWTDQQGKIHFSETPPADTSLEVKQIPIDDVKTTSFSQSPKIAPVYQTSTASRQTSTNNESKCEKLKREIKQHENDLRARKTYSYDRKEDELKDKRWQVLRECY